MRGSESPLWGYMRFPTFKKSPLHQYCSVRAEIEMVDLWYSYLSVVHVFLV